MAGKTAIHPPIASIPSSPDTSLTSPLLLDPRRSARSTKGVNPRLTEPEPSPAPAKRRKSTPAQKSASPVPSRKKTDEDPAPGEDEEEETDAIIRCVCGQTTEVEDDERMMIQCDGCTAWQHTQCMAIPKKKIPPQYFCEVCRPDLHEWLLEEMRLGEKPWEMKNAGKRKAAWERRRGEAEEKRKAAGGGEEAKKGGEKKKGENKKETPQPEEADREATIPVEEMSASLAPPPPPPVQETPKQKTPSVPETPTPQNIELKNGKSLAPIVTKAPEPVKKAKETPTPKSVKRKSSEDSDGEYKEEEQVSRLCNPSADSADFS